ncbi:MAG: family 1 glycosylhydrolase [Candidatus Limnocylindria bacterium]
MRTEDGTGTSPELWLGVECTHNRVFDRYFDQLDRSGHSSREGDVALIAGIGARAIRYPVLWERIAPDGLAIADWSWTDRRLTELRDRGLRVIAGLLHHGSGPASTGLLDPAFPESLARYARAVAERYPMLFDFTPVNEPLTTARFSALYGHWYPHARDDLSFARALLAQCRATVLSMEAIREVTPGARLVQTEDIGLTFSTRRLAYQADFENERRWLSFDLLTGRLGRDHPLWPWLISVGVRESELCWFEEHVCPPDIVGLNHYMTSQRFLDERVSLYPPATRGGNGRDRYADVEAVRARRGGIARPRQLLAAAWERYGLPLAITEVHTWSTREEQLRWFAEAWTGAAAARRAGADVRAVTAWALFGAYDWDRLATGEGDHYEPGAFDVTSGEPRLTALGALLRDIGHGRRIAHPALRATPWWRRPERIRYGPAGRGRASHHVRTPRTLLITGRTGTLGRALAAACDDRALRHRATARAELDIADAAAVRHALATLRPWAVLNAAGYVRVDEAETDPRCWSENADGPVVLAEACAREGIPLVTFSSDLVFDGSKGTAYVETDATAPLSAYGRAKAAAEMGVLASHDRALVVRTSAFFGPVDPYNFVTATIASLREGREVAAAADVVVSPTYVPDLVTAVLDLLIDGESGIWHLANRGSVSWKDLGIRAAEALGADARLVRPVLASELGWVAKRPANSALASVRGVLMPRLDDALARYAAATRWLQDRAA